jgi:hypothetical protein
LDPLTLLILGLPWTSQTSHSVEPVKFEGGSSEMGAHDDGVAELHAPAIAALL